MTIRTVVIPSQGTSTWVMEQKAKIASARAKMGVSLVVGGKGIATAQLIDQRTNALRPAVLANRKGSAAVHVRASRRRLRRARMQAVHGVDVRHHEATHREPEIAEEVGSFFEFANAGGEGIGHKLSPESIDGRDAIAPSRSKHRLCRDAK